MGLADWRKGVRESKRKFVWQAGALFGIVSGLLGSVLPWFIEDWKNHPVWSNSLKSVGFFLLFLVLGPLWGLLGWHLKKFLQRSA